MLMIYAICPGKLLLVFLKFFFEFISTWITKTNFDLQFN